MKPGVNKSFESGKLLLVYQGLIFLLTVSKKFGHLTLVILLIR